MPRTDLNLAVAQTMPVVADVRANVVDSAGLAAEAAAAGASMILFPELSLVGYDLDRIADDQLWIAEGDARLDPLRRCAIDDRITIAVGAPVLLDNGQRLLALVVVRPDGTEFVHGKQFLHGRENDLFDPAPPATTTLEVGGWQIALAICFDVAVPAHAAQAAALGADAYVASALYVEGEERRVDIHFASRAMDHRMYSVLANHAGPSPLGTSIGASGLWSPSGDRIREAGRLPETVLLRLEFAELERFRQPLTSAVS